VLRVINFKFYEYVASKYYMNVFQVNYYLLIVNECI